MVVVVVVLVFASASVLLIQEGVADVVIGDSVDGGRCVIVAGDVAVAVS